METLLSFLHHGAAIAFLVAMAYGGLNDLLTFRIPDWTSIVGVLAFPAAALTADWGGVAMLSNGAAGAAALAVGFGLFAARVIGGGDVKLLAVAALWFGWSGLPRYLLVVALLGGVLAVAVLAFRRRALPARLASVAWLSRLHEPGRGIPYGLAIAIAAMVLFEDLPVMSVGATGSP